MYVPQAKKTGPQPKHFLQKHPTIGRFFETFGCLGWAIIILVVTMIVMYVVPEWRPILLSTLTKIWRAWNYFWGEWIGNSMKWDWSAQPTPKKF